MNYRQFLLALALAWNVWLLVCSVAGAQTAALAGRDAAEALSKETTPTMTLEKIVRASEQLSSQRRALLDKAAGDIRQSLAGGPVHLLAVCTANSRRSQLCQAWCHVALTHYQVAAVDALSCGTQATACNPRTVAALERSGWRVERPSFDLENPRYACRFAQTPELVLWSKAFGDSSLPRERIVALLCCDEADKACPTVPGAIARVPLHYADPKASDGTAEESRSYDERSQQIAAEMFYLVRQIAGR